MHGINNALVDNQCCGCTACMCICPKDAISMVQNVDGFSYPRVEVDKCIKCGLCDEVCDYRLPMPNPSLKEVYAAVSCDTNANESASGGLFASFAQAVLSGGGVVYGCAMEYENGKLWPRHVCVSEIRDLIRLKGSKYVQSDMRKTFVDIQYRLRNGQTVLFSGTPCQVAGLKSFLRKKYDNLFTIDIVCHGVPSAKLFQDYIAYQERKLATNIISFRFRDKSMGWKLYGSMILGNKHTICFEPEESSYYQMFLNSFTYRENCYTCPYAGENRPGDVTIGDFWCIDLVHPKYLVQNGGRFDEQQGVSCMVVNNEHGQELLDRFGQGIALEPSSYEQAARYNAQLSHPSPLKEEREQIFTLYRKGGYELVENWYQKRLRKIRFVRGIRAAVPRWMKDMIKQMLKQKKCV